MIACKGGEVCHEKHELQKVIEKNQLNSNIWNVITFNLRDFDQSINKVGCNLITKPKWKATVKLWSNDSLFVKIRLQILTKDTNRIADEVVARTHTNHDPSIWIVGKQTDLIRRWINWRENVQSKDVSILGSQLAPPHVLERRSRLGQQICWIAWRGWY